MNNTQFLVPPFDPTGLAEMTAAQLLQYITGITPFDGKGFGITTSDSGTTPNVPDAISIPIFQACLWTRVQTASATVYVWNPSAAVDGTFQKWQPITSASIPDLSIVNSKYAPLSITDDKIANVSASKIIGLSAGILPGSFIPTGDLAYNVTTNPNSTYGNPIIAPAAVTGSKIAAQTITVANIALATLTQALLAASSVGTAQLIDLNVTAGKLAASLDLSGKTIILPTTTTIPQATFNAALTASTFISGDLTLVAGIIGNVAHGFSATPKQTRWVLKCTTTNAGYAVGDEIGIHSVWLASEGTSVFVDGANATNVWCTLLQTTGLDVLNKTTGAFTGFTATSWIAKCYAQS